MVFLPFSLAQTTTDLGESADNSVEAVRKAYAYSFDQLDNNDDMPGIGVLVAYGSGNGVTPEQTGEAFVKEFQRRGYRARYFYYDADWEGMTVEYRIGYSVLGPWGADSAAQQVGAATKRADAAQRVNKEVKN